MEIEFHDITLSISRPSQPSTPSEPAFSAVDALKVKNPKTLKLLKSANLNLSIATDHILRVYAPRLKGMETWLTLNYYLE
jgi:hypothetical protein